LNFLTTTRDGEVSSKSRGSISVTFLVALLKLSSEELCFKSVPLRSSPTRFYEIKLDDFPNVYANYSEELLLQNIADRRSSVGVFDEHLCNQLFHIVRELRWNGIVGLGHDFFHQLLYGYFSLSKIIETQNYCCRQKHASK